MQRYETLNALRRSEVVEVDGVAFVIDGDGTVRNGDTYIAERNTVQLLTASMVDHDNAWIVPCESAYAFDINECVHVKLAD